MWMQTAESAYLQIRSLDMQKHCIGYIDKYK